MKKLVYVLMMMSAVSLISTAAFARGEDKAKGKSAHGQKDETDCDEVSDRKDSGKTGKDATETEGKKKQDSDKAN